MRRNYESYLKHWSELEANVAADPELAAFVEPKRAELAAEEKGLREALDRQAAGKVEFHEATREIEGHVVRGNAVMVQLHDMIRGFYGRSAEILNLFRIQPRRPKPSSAAAKEARKAKKKPPEVGPNPSPTAASETDGTTREVTEV